MRIASARVDGFRLLNDVEISFEELTTIIVGRNNSGKTSFIEIFYKFLGADRESFSLDDFTVKRLDSLREAGECWRRTKEQEEVGSRADVGALGEEVYANLPQIRLDVEFAYDEEESLASIGDLILDLDPDRHDAVLRCEYSISRPDEFFSAWDKSSLEDIVMFARKHMRYFSRQFFAVDKEDETNIRTLQAAQVRAAIRTDFIYAQHLFDDTSLDSGHGLSKGFESYYHAVSDTSATMESLEAVLDEVASKLDGEYQSLFAGILGDLGQFGAGRMPSLQTVKVVSELRASNMLRGNTKVVYTHKSGADLPEAHNGLGFSKLIFIVLQFVAFCEAYSVQQPRPGVALVLLEEPEAHLHPQMQSIFIRNIGDYLSRKSDWNVQLVLTTHSSHIIAESGFSCLRYFRNKSDSLEIKDLNFLQVNLGESGKEEDREALRFLRQYMALHRCEMFFADKVILVEGAVERLVLPEMIRREENGLSNEYISIIEVGGAYALKFRPLLEFLGVRTLIITDIDSAEPTGRHKKTSTSTPGAVTTNATLSKWLPGEGQVECLLKMPESQKGSDDGNIRVVYQVPEADEAPTGRSFEEAFILANPGVLLADPNLSCARIFRDDNGNQLKEKDISPKSYQIADRIESKSDFAFDILRLSDWETPRYIREGLSWLAAR